MFFLLVDLIAVFFLMVQVGSLGIPGQIGNVQVSRNGAIGGHNNAYIKQLRVGGVTWRPSTSSSPRCGAKCRLKG
ncbi:hypothetical protein CPB84DRAFT_1788614 [Gymnopilus junonius]|uniref:Secreted protein n=1 Tax=Gymnopilus junonius TaxID=109634 RepID=A0A9P5TK86_GYMJU|nr:hypothetical protein CPB84DRAFT_1788614 [Gymnopilus junonius]